MGVGQIDWAPLFLFILVSAITPGPNNLACASMGVRFGYKRTLNFVLGISLGMALQASINGLISSALITAIPKFESIMRVIGAVYILWLAFGTFQMSLGEIDESKPVLDGKKGFLLQFINMKAIFATMTIFTTFLAPLEGHPVWIILAGSLLGVRTYVVNTVWCLFGCSIQRVFSKPIYLKIFNISAALVLVYTALNLLKIPEMIFGI